MYVVVTANNELIFGNSTYGYITTVSTITWLSSQLNCYNWEGNLATIESKQIDSLLYYLTTDYSCWIGLNDITTEAGTDASAFVWVDGSTSTYRQFATITNGVNEPSGDVGTAERDCVDFRFGNDGSSDGWDDRPCTANVNCYFCQKSGKHLHTRVVCGVGRLVCGGFLALGRQQARTIPDSTEFILNECKIFARY